MLNYIGEKCLICGELFRKDDDIVVCPDCGTPYHRACYKEKGYCVNDELHESGETWKTAKNEDFENVETMTCIYCGEENPVTGIFCKKCGKTINTNGGKDEQPFNYGGFPNILNNGSFFSTANSKYNEKIKIDEIEVKDYMTFVGKNPLYYISNFMNFFTTKSKVSLNFAAFLLTDIFYFYRKMYLPGLIFLAFRIISAFLIILNSNSSFDNTFINIGITDQFLQVFTPAFLIISESLRVVFSLFANYYYYLKAKKTIRKINNYDILSEDRAELISKKGGISFVLLLIIFILSFVNVFINMFY